MRESYLEVNFQDFDQIILLARHGNTFESDQIPFFVGAQEDLPLTARGREQALAVAQALQRMSLLPERVLCGPLSRTRESASIISEHLQALTPQVDPRLDELNYGTWSQKTDQQIIASYGRPVLENWTLRGQAPIDCGWQPPEDTRLREVSQLVQELLESNNRITLLLSSNGRFRYFLKLLTSDFIRLSSAGLTGIKPGHLAAIGVADKKLTLLFWNAAPTSF